MHKCWANDDDDVTAVKHRSHRRLIDFHIPLTRCMRTRAPVNRFHRLYRSSMSWKCKVGKQLRDINLLWTIHWGSSIQLTWLVGAIFTIQSTEHALNGVNWISKSIFCILIRFAGEKEQKQHFFLMFSRTTWSSLNRNLWDFAEDAHDQTQKCNVSVIRSEVVHLCHQSVPCRMCVPCVRGKYISIDIPCHPMTHYLIWNYYKYFPFSSTHASASACMTPFSIPNAPTINFFRVASLFYR